MRISSEKATARGVHATARGAYATAQGAYATAWGADLKPLCENFMWKFHAESSYGHQEKHIITCDKQSKGKKEGPT